MTNKELERRGPFLRLEDMLEDLGVVEIEPGQQLKPEFPCSQPRLQATTVLTRTPMVIGPGSW